MVSAPVKPETPPEPRTIGAYGQLKERLLGCIAGLPSCEQAGQNLCGELKAKLETETFNLVVVGQFKRGKTCLINALMGAEILPVAVIPLTSIVTVLTFGKTLEIKVYYNDGRVSGIEPEELPDYVTETGNPNNVKNVKEVVITYPSSYLKGGVRLIDTPGVGSVYVHNTDVAYRYLPKSDAALFLLSVDQPVSRAELEFLQDVKGYSHKIFFLLNKIDYLDGREVEESIEFTLRTLEEVMGHEVRVFPISAKTALSAKLSGSGEALEQSNLPAFSEVLEQFLMRDKGKVLLISVSDHLLRFISQEYLGVELELKSMATPLQELEEKIAAFERKKEEVLSERQQLGVLLDAEVERLIRTVLDEDLNRFKRSFAEQMEEGFSDFYESRGELSLKELNDALESYVVGEVEKAFDEWNAAEEEKLASEFESACGRFVKEMNDTVDTLLSFSSQLFSIPFKAVRVESAWSGESSFYYKMKGEAVGLDMLADSLTQVLPGYIGNRFKRFRDYVTRMANRFILNKRKRHMLETIDMQAGRIRFDFLSRINRSKQVFLAEMIEKSMATVEGIGAAIEKGRSLRSSGEKEAGARRAVLEARLAEMDRLRNELTAIKDAAEKM